MERSTGTGFFRESLFAFRMRPWAPKSDPEAHKQVPEYRTEVSKSGEPAWDSELTPQAKIAQSETELHTQLHPSPECLPHKRYVCLSISMPLQS